MNRPTEQDKRAAEQAVKNWHADVECEKRLETYIAEQVMQARSEGDAAGYQRGYDEGCWS